MLFWQVGVWAINPVAVELGTGSSIVETGKPHSADVSCKRPFSNPDIIFDFLSNWHVFLVEGTVVVDGIHLPAPCDVVMSIHNDILMVIVIEHGVPALTEVESILEHKLQSRLLLSHQVAYAAVEVHKSVSGSVAPWFVNRFNSINSRVITPLFQESINGIQSPVNVILVNIVVRLSILVPITDPVSTLVTPVVESVLSPPDSLASPSRVVKTVLGVFDGMNIK
mmetsp:Transcript_44632/g.60496  ORF Transcript_44632/g.60496 Transcript_44632/m.60496 type:complete len:224 (-) Transcript_44632:103-774(-)